MAQVTDLLLYRKVWWMVASPLYLDSKACHAKAQMIHLCVVPMYLMFTWRWCMVLQLQGCTVCAAINLSKPQEFSVDWAGCWAGEASPSSAFQGWRLLSSSLYGFMAPCVIADVRPNAGIVAINECCLLSAGTDITNAEEVAIKLECIKTKHPQLHIESKIYKMMQGGGKYQPTAVMNGLNGRLWSTLPCCLCHKLITSSNSHIHEERSSRSSL